MSIVNIVLLVLENQQRWEGKKPKYLILNKNAKLSWNTNIPADTPSSFDSYVC